MSIPGIFIGSVRPRLAPANPWDMIDLRSMDVLGFLSLVASCFLAWGTTRRPDGPWFALLHETTQEAAGAGMP